jgi:ABC-type multidrug transport system ATPase subunit
MELMCDRIYIIDNGVIIGEKRIHQEEETVNDNIYQYTFVTDNNEKILGYFKKRKANCEIVNGGVNVVMKRSEIPGL